MVSKIATLFLVIHTVVTLTTTVLLQNFSSSTNKYAGLSSQIHLLFSLLIHLQAILACFLPLSFLNYCCIRARSRITFKRHLVTAFLIAPLISALAGRWVGWIEKGNGEDVMGASACFEQLDARDEMVLSKALWCELKFGLTRGQAESSIGARRERPEYVESLAQACQEGLRDVSHFPSPVAAISWMGQGTNVEGDEWEEGREGEPRNGKLEYFRRAFEECHAKFGVEVTLEWRDEQPVIRYRVPDLAGLKQAGKWIDISQDDDPSTLLTGE